MNNIYKYKYITENNKYTLIELVIQLLEENKTINIHNRDNKYIVSIFDNNKYIMNSDKVVSDKLVPSTYLKDITIKELLNIEEKPIILSATSNCEYIIKNDNDFDFLRTINGKMINLTFSNDKILVYYKKSDVLYVYNRDNSVFFKEPSEKHIFTSDGLFSNYTYIDGSKIGSFISINEKYPVDLSAFEQCIQYNIAPFVYRTYKHCSTNKGSYIIVNKHKQELLYNSMDPKPISLSTYQIEEYTDNNGYNYITIS